MFKLVSLATRNLWRNLRRTLITLAAISFGLAMIMMTMNIATGSYRDMTVNGISQLAGHVVVQADGWQQERDDALRIERASEVAAVMAERYPEATVTTRAFLNGLLVAPLGSVGVAMSAFDAVAEAPITDLDNKLVEGAWLDPDSGTDLVIGEEMARTLQVGLGDKVVYMGQHSGDEVDSRLFRVSGIFKTGASELDGFVAAVNLSAAQELMGQPDTAHQVALHVPSPEASAEATEALAAALADRPELEVLSWRQAISEIAAMIEVDKLSNHVMLAIIGLIVAMGVLNTVLMSVLERTREFGVMLALGVKPRRLATIVLLEGAVLGAIGAVLGWALGLLFTWPLVVYGIDYGAMMGEAMTSGGVVMSSVMKAAWDWERMGVAAVLTVVATWLAAAWPAWRVTSLQPVDAMRHV